MCWNLAVEFVLLINISLTLCFSSEARNVKSLLHDDSSKSSRLISGATVVSVECNKPALYTNPSNKLCSQSLERPNLFPPVVPPIVPSPPPTFGGVPLPPSPFQPPPLLPYPQPPSPPAFGLPLIPGLIPSPPPPPPLLPLPPGLPRLPVPLPPVIPGVPPANKHKVTP